MAGWFITATDTGAGKTWVAEALLLALRHRNRRAAGMKPVASGCRVTPAGLRSEDAERLLAASATGVVYQDVNPYAFGPPIAPHLAASRVGIEMQLETVQRHYARLAAHADWMVVEGVGGWRVPFNRALSMSDVARALALPAILVVGLRLGCISHALLTAAAIRADGVEVAGWVANSVDPAYESLQETIAALDERLGAPRLAAIPPASGQEQRRYGETVLSRLL